MRRSQLTIALTVVALASTAACFPGMRRDGRGVADGLDRRPVSAKEAPASLFAADGSRCLVTESRFRDARIGQSVWCWWNGPGSDTEGSRGGTPSDAGAAAGAKRMWDKVRAPTKLPKKSGA